MKSTTRDQLDETSGDLPKRTLSRFGRSLIAMAVVAVGLPLISLIPDANPAQADPASNAPNVTQTTPGALSGGTVPDGICSATITATGGSGGSGGLAAANGGRGGAGAVISATVRVLAGQSYSGSVGGGGLVNGTGGVGGGGDGGTIVNLHRGAGGGGRTVVSIGGITMVVAGGGGGGGGAHNAGPPLPGNGGDAGSAVGAGVAGVGSNGGTGVDNPNTNIVGGGQGGQAAAGGAGGVNSNLGTAEDGFAGGGIGTGDGGNGGPDANYDSAGGGGAGYTGGGGGASTEGDTVTGAGGGGGSSWVVATSPTAAGGAPTSISGSNTPETPFATNGADGEVTIDWIPCQYDLAMTKTVATSPIVAGDQATWTVSITNNGPDAMTRGDTISLADTLPAGPNAATPGPSFRVASISTSGGSNSTLLSGPVTCTGVTVGSTMPASTVCSRAYAPAAGTPGTPPATSGTRGLNVGETLTIVYEQVISNTAPCATITNTATITDRPTLSGTTDVIGVATVDSVATPLVIQCYDLAVSKSASPLPYVALGGTITWTVTVTNNGPGPMNGPVATVANPLVVTDVFPSTGVGSATLTNATGPAGACSLVGSTVTCATGLPASGVQVLTFTQTVQAGALDGAVVSNTATVSDPRTGDSNDSSTATTTVRHPRITLNKTIASRVNAADQFVINVVNGASTVGTATTSGAATSATTGVVLAGAGTYTLNEAMAGGSPSTIGQYSNSIACTNTNSGSSTVLPSGSGTSFNVSPSGLDDITCTFTNTPHVALISVSDTTFGGVGPFDYALTNLSSANTTITTTVAGTPTTSSQFTATTVNSAVTIAETVPTGWQFNTATCSDSNSAVTGNTGNFGTLVGSTLTIPAGNVRAGSIITCAFSNTKLAQLTISKSAVGAGGAFDFSSTGGLTPSTFTLNPNPPTVDSRTFANVAPGAYSVTELGLTGFRLADITCADVAGGATGSTNTPNIATGVLSLSLVAGANYACTFSNIANADVAVIKNTVGGEGTFTYTTANTGNVTDPTLSITTTSGSGADAFDVPFDAVTNSRNITITEDPLGAGWVLTAIACTDDLGDPIGTPDIGTRSVTLTATPGAAVSCRFTNERLPTVVIRTQSIGGTSPFDYSAGTNGLPSNLTLDTGSANPASSGVYTLNALNTSTAITQTTPTNYNLMSVTCVDESSTPVSVQLLGGVLTIDQSAIVGGADLVCTFVNQRKSAQVRVDKTWINGEVGNQVTISSTGGTNNPGLVAIANSISETDVGTAVTVYAGETLSFSETFDVGSSGNYSTDLACTNAADGDPSDGLDIVAGDDGANIVCTYTNTGLADVSATKTAGTVTGPDGGGVFQASYTVTVTNAGIAPTTYGQLVDTPSFDANLIATGASWTTSGPGAPGGGSAVGVGPYTLAPAGSPISNNTTHTYTVTISFTFATYSVATACSGSPGAGLYNEINLVSGDATPSDNSACLPPPLPPTPSINIVKTAQPTSVSAAGQSIAYSFRVTNIGNVTLTSVGVSDPLSGLSAVTCPVSTLTPGGFTTCSATYTVRQSDVDAGSIANTATATGTPPVGQPVTDRGSASVTAAKGPSVAITKATTSTGFNAVGQQVPFTITVVNNGNVTLTNVTITDPNAVIGACTPSAPVTLAPTQAMSCAAVHTVTQADLTALSISNTAYVAAESGALDVSGTSNIVVVPGSVPPVIPRTGWDATSPLRLVGALMLGGVGLLIVARRRRPFYLVLPPL